MKNHSPKNTFALGFILAALLLSFNAGALQQSGSMSRLIYACEQELQTLCSRLNDPNQAIMCLQENEPQLQTRACTEEVQNYTSNQNFVPEASEEPFIDKDTNEAR